MTIAAQLTAIWNDPIVLLAAGVVVGIVVARWLATSESESSSSKDSDSPCSGHSSRYDGEQLTIGLNKLAMLRAKHKGYLEVWDSFEGSTVQDDDSVQDLIELVVSNLHELLEVLAELPESQRLDPPDASLAEYALQLAMMEGQWLLGGLNSAEILSKLNAWGEESLLGS